MAHWLVKSEPNIYSITDFKKEKFTLWDGVRNYQARNYLRSMEIHDEVLFYHSQVEPMGIMGLSKVSCKAFADPTQFDAKSKYYDPAATPEAPRWYAPRLKFQREFKHPLTLEKMRTQKDLKEMILLKRGNRLSVLPVSENEYRSILQLVD